MEVSPLEAKKHKQCFKSAQLLRKLSAGGEGGSLELLGHGKRKSSNVKSISFSSFVTHVDKKKKKTRGAKYAKCGTFYWIEGPW
jgi:hypothetical protein